MKKIFSVFLIIACAFIFTGCDFVDGVIAKIEDLGSSKNTSRKTVPYKPLTDGDGSVLNMFKPTKLSTYKSDFFPKQGLMPSTGTVKALVIPIEFSDALYTQTMKNNINRAFISNSDGYTLNSFYKESSYNQLNIDSTILDAYNTNQSSSSFTTSAQVRKLINVVLKYYDSIIDYSDYDADNDGYIDALYFLYTRNHDSDSDIWWAFHAYTSSLSKYDGVKSNGYVWAGIDFAAEDAYTYIHETAHMMGADDYYDYNDKTGSTWGVGGFDLMDETEGDHNPFTKMMMGWITPTVITGGAHSVELGKFSKTGDAIIVNASYNGDILDEYFIIDYFDYNDGINKNRFITKSGIRIYHVNSTYTGLHLYEDEYPNIFDYDNSDTDLAQLSLIEAKMPKSLSLFLPSKSIMDGGNAHNNALFYSGMTFNPNSISTNQFVDQANLKFVVNVISLGDTATIEVIFS